MTRRLFTASPLAVLAKAPRGPLRAGAAAANINPHIGAPLAGSFTAGVAADIHDDLFARSLVLDNGHTRVALVLLDLCTAPASVIESAKKATGLPPENIVICCTHTHSAPAATHIFQARPEPEYLAFLTRRIVDSVRMAAARLELAQIGFAFGREDSLAFSRRYFMKDGSVAPNPFGGIDKVKTNPGAGNPAVVRAAGPIDPALGLLSVRTASGKPVAVVGNFSLHYVGGVKSGDVSADYFGYWAAEMTKRTGAPVAMLFNGAQGDVNNIDVMRGPAEKLAPYVKMEQVARQLAEKSAALLTRIDYSGEAELGGSLEWLDLGVRLPSPEDVKNAQKTLQNTSKNDVFRDLPFVYARETLIMAETWPKREKVPVQALRIGNTGVACLPGEPFVELGLEMRRKSPLKQQFVLGLSNGHVGYIPTVEAHEQGGYETWRAKTSYLEKDAAPEIVAAMLRRIQAIL